MGTSSALERLLSRARTLELSVGLCDPCYDIALADDLIACRGIGMRLRPRRPNRAAGLNMGDSVTHLRRARRRGESDSNPRVYGLGAILLVSLFICARISASGRSSFSFRWRVSSVAYLLAMRESSFAPTFPRHGTSPGSCLAALCHLSISTDPPFPDYEYHRYFGRGGGGGGWRVRRLGPYPYVVVPSDPRFQRLATLRDSHPQPPGSTKPISPALAFSSAAVHVHDIPLH